MPVVSFYKSGYIDRGRVSLIKDKLDQLQVTMSKHRMEQLEKLNNQISVLETRMKSTLDSRESLFNIMGSQVIRYVTFSLINWNRL